MPSFFKPFIYAGILSHMLYLLCILYPPSVITLRLITITQVCLLNAAGCKQYVKLNDGKIDRLKGVEKLYMEACMGQFNVLY
jgi:hypothetical protein